jgi:hypothetical protein
MGDVIDRAEGALKVFDEQPERYLGARGVIRALMAELKATRAAIDLIQLSAEWGYDNPKHPEDGPGPCAWWGEAAEPNARQKAADAAKKRHGLLYRRVVSPWQPVEAADE